MYACFLSASDCNFSNKAKTHVFSYTHPYPFIRYLVFIPAFCLFTPDAYFRSCSDSAKTRAEETIDHEDCTCNKHPQEKPFKFQIKNKAIWRIAAPSINKIAVIPLSFTLVALQGRSYYFSPSPGEATMERAPEKPGSRMCMLQGSLRNTGPGCLW